MKYIAGSDDDSILRRFKEKKEAVEPKVDPKRDQRTVFAYQVAAF